MLFGEYTALLVLPCCIDTRAIIFRQAEAEEQGRDRIRDPPIVSSKGRPRSARITSAIEGAPRGGGPITRRPSRRNRRDRSPSPEEEEELEQEEEEPEQEEEEDEEPRKKRSYKCGLCGREGHRRDKCAWA